MKTKQVQRSTQFAVICVEKGEALCVCVHVHTSRMYVCIQRPSLERAQQTGNSGFFW